MTEPEILVVERMGAEVRIALRIQPELNWFRGHFAAVPLLPAVVQTHWAVTFGRRYFQLRSRFTGMNNVKFMRFIGPGARIQLRLRQVPDQGDLVFAYFDGESACASGRMRFDD